MSVSVTFLGGLGEIGRNCAAVEIDGKIALIDVGTPRCLTTKRSTSTFSFGQLANPQSQAKASFGGSET